MPPKPSEPGHARFPSTHLTLGAGVAIFHLATARVVVCYDTREHYYFLPKGRKNVGESLDRAAEREGFEESGYRNRVLPIVMGHYATYATGGADGGGPEGREEFVSECVWMQMMPVGRGGQYTLFWFVAETLSPEDEDATNGGVDATGGSTDDGVTSVTATLSLGDASNANPALQPYRTPPPYPKDLTLTQRIAQDTITTADGKTAKFQPRHHENTAQDEEEACYRSHLLPVDEACRLLQGSVQEDVIRRGWEGIQLRMEIEMQRETEEGREELLRMAMEADRQAQQEARESKG